MTQRLRGPSELHVDEERLLPVGQHEGVAAAAEEEPEPGVDLPLLDAQETLHRAPAGDRQSYINDSVKARVWHSQRYFDEEKIKTDYARSYDRSFYPEGASRQLAAIYASGSREEALTKITLPTLVIHGTDDTLLQPSGGQRTADLIPGSTLFMVADMGHDMPEPLQPLLTSVIGSHVKLAEWHRTTDQAIR
jgi:pimeloyl-ACP methyl ester carboxylesterase